MNHQKLLNRKAARRKRRNRAKVFGTKSQPRLSVFRSNRFIYAQLIDDTKSLTVVNASSCELNKKKGEMSKIKQAELVGEALAKKALQVGIKQAIFDRGSYYYHGRIKALAEGARMGGLKI